MLLKDVKKGETCIVEKVSLPVQMKRRLEALGMTKETPVTVVNRKGKGFPVSSYLVTK